MFEKTKAVATVLAHPLIFLAIACWYRVKTFFSLLVDLDFRTLASPSRFQAESFARFWRFVTLMAPPEMRQRIKPLMVQATGVVLDLGPGTGDWLDLFVPTNVTKIYGIEPNLDQHDLLRKKIKECGLSDIYTIVPAGVEDLGTFGIDLGTIDSITAVQCLCSVAQPRTTIQDLYGYLKPGGKWIVYEHVVTREKGILSWYQRALDVVWPHLVGGCSITRDTEKFLRDAGDWSKIDLGKPENEPRYHMLPRLFGVLVK